MPVEELGYALLARAGVQTPERTPVLLVECNEPELDQYKAELEEQLPVVVEAVLLEKLERHVSEKETPWRLAVTTFYHVQEVEKLMEPHGIETFALLPETTLEGLRRLAGRDARRGGWQLANLHRQPSTLFKGRGVGSLEPLPDTGGRRGEPFPGRTGKSGGVR
jgi:hypothetical protein